MGRRGENIRYRKWDKRWEARVVCGPPVNGKTQYKYIYGKSYKEVRMKKKALEKLLDEASERNNTWHLGEVSKCNKVYLPGGAMERNKVEQPGGSGEPSAVQPSCPEACPSYLGEITFIEAEETWLESKKMVLKDSSYATYSYLARHYLMPMLGDLQLNSITGDTLKDLFACLREHGRNRSDRPLSDKTMCDIRMVLVQILSYAASHGMMANVPECPSVPARKPSAKALETLEQGKMEDAAILEDTNFTVAVILLLYSGLRDGEICGLKWGDIDLAGGVLHVQRTVTRIRNTDSESPKTKVVIGSPKTECSRRTVPLPDWIIRYLEDRRLGDDIYVATGTRKYMEPRAFLGKFKRFLSRNRLADCTVHTLRHSYATQCIKYGVDVKSLSEIMGHANVKITMQLYVHPSMESKKAEVNKLPCIISGQKSGQDFAGTVDL